MAILIAPTAEDVRRSADALVAGAGEVIRVVRSGQWAGEANALSPSHVDWAIINDVAEATQKPATRETFVSPPGDLPRVAPAAREGALAAEIIRRRRSAVSLDGSTSIEAATLYAMLDRLLPRPGVPPWDAIPWAPHIHAILFVHRVRGLAPGLYALERSEAAHDRLRSALTPTFDWERPPGCPEHLRLYRLAEADVRELSQIVSCHQDIAADGAFSLGMIADFSGPLQSQGAHWYRRLFWEAGALGHVLYLEAEAALDSGGPIRATGIGCYFDDVFHELCGISSDEFQSLYHFTVGGPVDDARLRTTAPYDHLDLEGRAPASGEISTARFEAPVT
jgi:hypothetical protein